MPVSEAEEALAFQLRSMGYGGWEREYMFAKSIGRKWRFDFCHPGLFLAVEIEGFGGRHQSMKGFRMDLDKYDAAARLGWLVLRTSAAMVKSGHTLETIEILLGLKREST